MLHYSYEQLAIIISIPIVTIFLVWTTAIFFKNRRTWAPFDIPIVSLFILSIIRNLTILSYVLVLTLNKHIFNIEYCSILVWVFNSIHTFQASNLSTLAVIGLLSSKLKRKHQTLKHFLNSTHVLYHLFCLITLCACVGVAALLARHSVARNFENITLFTINPCKLMPFDLDLKYNVFIIVLHLFLASISFLCFIFTCVNLIKIKRSNFEYIKKSNSDISDSSFSNNNTIANDKNYYDTYTIHRQNNCQQNFYISAVQNQVGYCQNRDSGWNSDLSNLSTTVSSTNSRKPCLPKALNEAKLHRTGLETINPILVVCYLVYHIPVLVLCIQPHLLYPWPVAGIALWLGLLQDILLPLGLGLVDTRFSSWVSDVYRCSRSRLDEKLPHVGLDGKFRPFGSQPQSLEIVQMAHERNLKSLQSVEHRFPITNGSLYTSIDGRLPVIHNYRRNRDQRVLRLEPSSSNPALHTAHLKRQDMPVFTCSSCETDQCPSHSNLHHLSPEYINRKLNALHQNNNVFQQVPLRNTISHESLSLGNIEENPIYVSNGINNNNSVLKNSRNLVRLNRMKLTKSEDSLNNFERNSSYDQLNSKPFISFEEKKKPNKKNNEQILDYSSSDEDYDENYISNNFDTMSSKSSCSITTEANGDFHFYQSSQVNQDNEKNISDQIEKLNNDLLLAKYSKFDMGLENFTLRNGNPSELQRIHSKRSVENFQAFLEDKQYQDRKIARCNSYVSLEDHHRIPSPKRLMRSTSKLSDCTHIISKKIKSVEYLPETNASTWVIENCRYVPHENLRIRADKKFQYAGSVPDLKKVFISEYI